MAAPRTPVEDSPSPSSTAPPASTAPSVPGVAPSTGGPTGGAGQQSAVERLRDAEQAIHEFLNSYADKNPAPDGSQGVEVSVVLPCLNEAETLGSCIRKAQRAMREAEIVGEVIVADNGSTDGSYQVATELGARVVLVDERGYGQALMAGIEAARGEYIVMGDADDSYDFLELPKFVEQLRAGHDLVQGCRLPAGGGEIRPGAMPPLHRWLGNPMFSWMVQQMFDAPVHDVYCGLRGFTRELYDRLELRCTGMEFATEMVVKSSLFGASITEVPTTLYPDGRRSHGAHLRTFRDGWRTLRFFLIYSPRWCFLMPGVALAVLGLLGYALALPGVTLWGATLDAHTLLVASLSILLGSQLLQLALFAKTFAISEKLIPPSRRMQWFERTVTLELGVAVGVGAFAVGCGLLAVAVGQWWGAGFGRLDYAVTMRWVIPGVTLAALGCQTLFASFFLSLLRMARR